MLLSAGVASPYDHLWSLPTRVLDAGLRRLVDLLPRAPTWLAAGSNEGYLNGKPPNASTLDLLTVALVRAA